MGRLAYSLSQAETGWNWSVYDEEGVTIATGAAASQARALAAVNTTLQAASQAPLGLRLSAAAAR